MPRGGFALALAVAMVGLGIDGSDEEGSDGVSFLGCCWGGDLLGTWAGGGGGLTTRWPSMLLSYPAFWA